MGERGRKTRIRLEWLHLTKPLNRSIKRIQLQGSKTMMVRWYEQTPNNSRHYSQ